MSEQRVQQIFSRNLISGKKADSKFLKELLENKQIQNSSLAGKLSLLKEQRKKRLIEYRESEAKQIQEFVATLSSEERMKFIERNYSWGEFYETVLSCDNYLLALTEEQKKLFTVFDQLDNATSLGGIRSIIELLTEKEINWLNSPCLDGLVYSVSAHIPIWYIITTRQDKYVETCRFYLSKKLDKKYFIKACENGLVNIAKLFIEYGANIHKNHNEAFIEACGNGHMDVVKLLIEHGVDIHCNFIGYRALTRAASTGQPEIVKFLIENKIDIHYENDDSLMHACNNGRLETVKTLLENGANIHAQNNRAIQYAFANANTELIKILLEHGAVPSTNDINKAFNNNRLEIFQVLIQLDKLPSEPLVHWKPQLQVAKLLNDFWEKKN